MAGTHGDGVPSYSGAWEGEDTEGWELRGDFPGPQWGDGNFQVTRSPSNSESSCHPRVCCG